MNQTLFLFLYDLGQNATFQPIVVFLGEFLPYLVIVFTGIFMLMHKEVLFAVRPWTEFKQKWKEICLVFVTSLFAWVLARVLKIIIAIERPFQASTEVHQLINPYMLYSFPSGHATFFSALALTIYLKHKTAGYILMLFALLISLGRVMAGVHTPIDILGGFLLGFLIAYFFKNV